MHLVSVCARSDSACDRTGCPLVLYVVRYYVFDVDACLHGLTAALCFSLSLSLDLYISLSFSV